MGHKRKFLIAALVCWALAIVVAIAMAQSMTIAGPEVPQHPPKGYGTSSDAPGTDVPIIGTIVDLKPSLQNVWKMDEASGSRADSVGGITLANVGSVPGVAGKDGNAASFVPTRALLSSPSDPPTTGDITFTTWAKTSEVAGAVYAAGLKYAVDLAIFPSGAQCKIQLIAYDPVTTVTVGTATDPSLGGDCQTKYVLLTARYRAATKQWTLRHYEVGNGSDRTNLVATGVATNPLGATQRACFNLHQCTDLSTNMLSDESVIWARYLQDYELDDYWNRFYPFP
jgi:hypothetical protein